MNIEFDRDRLPYITEISMTLVDRINNPQPITVKLWGWISGMTLAEIAQRLGMTRARFLELNPQYQTQVPQIGDRVFVDWER